jgi:hypothetical protein
MVLLSRGQELVELPHIRRRHVQVPHPRRLFRSLQRWQRAGVPALTHAEQDDFHVEAGFAAAALDDALHLVGRMVVEQLQDADVVLGAAGRSVLALQRGPQLAEDGWQLPAAEDVGVVERRRPALQRLQVVLRVEDLLMLPVGARVGSDHLAAKHQIDARDVGLDRHGLEGHHARYAVAIGVEADHLVLVHLGRLEQARIEGMSRQ